MDKWIEMALMLLRRASVTSCVDVWIEMKSLVAVGLLKKMKRMLMEINMVERLCV